MALEKTLNLTEEGLEITDSKMIGCFGPAIFIQFLKDLKLYEYNNHKEILC